MYAEPRGEEAGPVWRKAPGLLPFVSTDEEVFRGAIVMPGVVYVGFTDKICAIEQGATSDGLAYLVSTHGTLSGADKLFFARNNNSVPDIVAVGSAGPFIITSGGVSSYPDPDVGAPNAVGFLAGYFFFTYGDGKCRTSGINTTAINLNDLATAEQHPDGLLRPIPFRSTMLLCGTRTIEVWANSGNPEGFPFSYSHTIAAGLLNANAIAGGHAYDEFSEFLIWIADDNTVRRLDGWEATKISPPWLDALIEAEQDKTVFEVTVYTSKGYKFGQISCPNWTYVFDFNTQKWHGRDSYLQPRSRMTQAFPIGGAFAGVSKWLCGDTLSGGIHEISSAARDEVGQPFVGLMESVEVKNFPNRIQVSRGDFDFVTGVGVATGADPIQTDPEVNIAWSDDGGVRWSKPLIRKLGRQQRATQRVTVLNTGLSGPQGRRWRWWVSDPVDVVFLGADQSSTVRAK
jgi:hypothetical protein